MFQFIQSQSIPNNYTFSSTIQINQSSTIKQIIYSYDQKTLIYTTLLNNKCLTYQMGLLTYQNKTKVCMNDTIYDIKYSPLMDKIYVLISYYNNVTYGFQLLYSSIYYGSSYLYIEFQRLDYIRNTSNYDVKMQISYDYRTAISTYNELIIVTITKDNTYYTQRKNINRIRDIKWHPLDKDILIISYGQQQDSWLVLYNVKFKQFLQKTKSYTQSINIIMNGSVIMAKSYKQTIQGLDIINIYRYQNQQITLIQDIQGYYLSSKGIYSVFNNVIGLVQNNQDNHYNQIHLFQITYQQISNQPLLIANNQLKYKYKQKYQTQNTSIQSHQSSILQSQYSLKLLSIIETNYKSNDKQFNSVMSADTNQIYFNIPYTYQIQRLTRCKDGMYLSNGQCLKCDTDCTTCHRQKTNCMTCVPYAAYYNQSCNNCNTKYKGCQTCNMTTCLTCKMGFIKQAEQYECRCKQGTYAQSDSECIKCSDVLDKCLRCSSKNTCLQCEDSGFNEPDHNGKCGRKQWITVLIIIGSLSVGTIVIIMVINKLCKRRKQREQKKQKKKLLQIQQQV